MKENMETIGLITIIIMQTTIAGACIFAWVMLIKHWKSLFKSKD